MDVANPDPNSISTGGGRGMYMADVLTGDYFWGRTHVGDQDPAEADMDYPIPSDVATIDLDGDGRVDRIYVGDTNGNIWKFNIGDLNKDGTTNPADLFPQLRMDDDRRFSKPIRPAPRRRGYSIHRMSPSRKTAPGNTKCCSSGQGIAKIQKEQRI